MEIRHAVSDALALITRYGGTDGGHHKQWVLDQVVRVLTEDRYDAWVREYRAGGEYHAADSYEWSVGIAP